MPESLEIQIARIQEQLKAMDSYLQEGREDRKTNLDSISRMITSVEIMERRLQKLEDQFAKSEPTIQEFITIKHQVKGAGALGRWAWAFGVGLIAMLYSSRSRS